MTGLILVGAGTGLGAGIARRFAGEGLGVSLISRRASSLERVASTLSAYAVSVAAYPADAGRPDQLETALAAAFREHGVPDVVVYNAAVIRADAPGELSPEELAETWSVNVAGVLVAAMATIPLMQQRGHGTFLVTGGMPLPKPSHVSLSLGKAAVRALTSMLAEQFGPQGVHVATITVGGEILPGTALDPDLIAEQYWRLHEQPPGAWDTELLIDDPA